MRRTLEIVSIEEDEEEEEGRRQKPRQRGTIIRCLLFINKGCTLAMT